MLQIGLLTMYNEDPTILNSTYFPLPEGINHTTLDPLLLAEAAELELLYPEPNTLKTVIFAWSMARNPAWAKMLEALSAEYSPIENYDRSENWTDTRNLADNHSGSENRQSTGQSAGTRTGQEATSSIGQEATTSTGQEATTSAGQEASTSTRQEDSSSTGSDTETVVGYNDTTWTNKGKHETAGGLNSSSNGSDNRSTSGEENKSTSGTENSSTSGEVNRSTSGSENLSTSGSENRTDQSADTHTGTIQHTSRIHGNIGVTTAQQMIQAELELRKMDVYNLIVKEFIKMFCLGVY